ncbi:hypothetical protein SARC_15247 [Sphaeroforma arctica JP610]|uniref:Uncharacterized protein n=1 Tax=Sphaeroforma arctica JP610 TaxID=667725 RepID=A0A0L0F6K8_9EUKA|nr:hypothetical protein SARC_15247 [Sphaeroforma arctica JP610]KNC72201.1 hypothetical protein SARC_15247 [Sphaeroforma arctica JP610]|eukprot:XP_014146103.1 hypothetical protein SARC_15247 [Sphaeroforma arctica JP610]
MPFGLPLVTSAVLVRIATDYPHALAYAFNTSMNTADSTDTYEEQAYIEQIRKLLHHPVRAQMTTELLALTDPNMLYRDWLEIDLDPLIKAPKGPGQKTASARAYSALISLPFMKSARSSTGMKLRH